MFVTTDPREAYNQLLRDGLVRPDPAQSRAVDHLQLLADELADYGQQMGKTGWRGRLVFRGRRRKPPKGLYMWGGVGRGKTMLMDLFYDHCGVEERKHVHFHAFMQEVHKRVHVFRQAQQAGKVAKGQDPLKALARVITGQAWLLCFDEFHVTDIADAMILGRLFEELFNAGVVVVATSNRHPRDLYKDGLQRERFLPFIDLFLEKMDVLELDNGIDYRLERLRALGSYMTPHGPEVLEKMEQGFCDLALCAESRPVTLSVHGRDLVIPRAAEGVAFTTFDDLCDKPLGAGDYLAIAEYFHTVFIIDVPLMGPEKRNQAKRFVTLIDALYDARVNVVLSAAAPPNELYVEGDGAFEFERTVSRLMEMQAEDYIAQPHNPQVEAA